MKKLLVAALVLAPLLFAAAPADAFKGHVQSCYKQVWQPPVYRTTQHLVRAAYTQIEPRGTCSSQRRGHCSTVDAVKVHYPAVYKEKRTMVKAGRYVLQQVACDCKQRAHCR